MSVAFFDMDGTLVNGDTNDQTLKYLLDQGVIDQNFIEPAHAYHQAFFNGTLNFPQFVEYIVSPLIDLDPHDLHQILDGIVKTRIMPLIKNGAHQALYFHRQRHDTIVIVTSTMDYLVNYVAQYLDIEHVIATPMEKTAQGRLTGKITGLIPYQEGKVKAINKFIQEHSLSLTDSYAYGDTVNDLPMLLACEHRYAVDANRQLVEHPDYSKLQAVSWL